jgi:hypothetical protein
LKNLIAAFAFTVLLPTSAMAEKPSVMIVDDCTREISYMMILYHLDKIEAALAELELQAHPKQVENPKDE